MTNQFDEAFQVGGIEILELGNSKDENLKACSRVSTYSNNGLSLSTIISMEEENTRASDHANDLEVAEDNPKIPRNSEYHSILIKRITKQEYSCINLRQINKKRKIMQAFLHLADGNEMDKETSEVHLEKASEVSVVNNACSMNSIVYKKK